MVAAMVQTAEKFPFVKSADEETNFRLQTEIADGSAYGKHRLKPHCYADDRNSANR